MGNIIAILNETVGTRNLEFAQEVSQSEAGDNLLALFFTGPSRIFRHKFTPSVFSCHETVNASIFDAPFFQKSATILVCFPCKNGLEVYRSHRQSELRAYLFLEHTVDYGGDIYLFSDDLKWCICYIDEFYPDNSRMTFLHSDDELI